uniref:Glycosyl transferase family 1 domain-containing protein n=2 Tax=Micromonas pusilla TaxID=38833 RepID=A0A7S0PSW5_MICPS|mmetsp:Transcript_3331/g.12455  ORF Transcript_3331/g.12455 Transcript_3331/m.12455 type:complete len:635 (+) Transcript_3331:508-2412(+)
MDVVVVAARADQTLAVSVHNLYHLCGFRRFVLFVDDKRSCDIMMSLVPGTDAERARNRCFEHTIFYTSDEVEGFSRQYPKITRGDLRDRGGKKVYVSRLGWHLQQFSKLLAYRVVPDLSEQFLAIDGDIVFTRPYPFYDRGRLVLPVINKSSCQWSGLIENFIGASKSGVQDCRKHSNVVGWLPLSTTIIVELLDHIEKKSGTSFPFNVLEHAEKTGQYFSEFQAYVNFMGNDHRARYREEVLKPEKRNIGITKSCSMSFALYHESQADMSRSPYFVWEEHKYREKGDCEPDRFSDDFQDIWSFIGFKEGEDNNTFLRALRTGIIEQGMRVETKSDINIESMSPLAGTILASSAELKRQRHHLEQLLLTRKFTVLHRIEDLPNATRHGRSDYEAQPLITDEDIDVERINNQLACATIFQSRWNQQAHTNIGLKFRNPVVVPYAVDPSIFHPGPQENTFVGRKVRIVSSTHTIRDKTYFDSVSWLATNLDTTTFEYFHVGDVPNWVSGSIQILPGRNSSGLADVLRSGDIYFAPSTHELISTTMLEALSCGLPVLYQEDGKHRELVGLGGRDFVGVGESLVRALADLVENYAEVRASIHVPELSSVAQAYANIGRWCQFMSSFEFEPFNHSAIAQ